MEVENLLPPVHQPIRFELVTLPAPVHQDHPRVLLLQLQQQLKSFILLLALTTTLQQRKHHPHHRHHHRRHPLQIAGLVQSRQPLRHPDCEPSLHECNYFKRIDFPYLVDYVLHMLIAFGYPSVPPSLPCPFMCYYFGFKIDATNHVVYLFYYD